MARRATRGKEIVKDLAASKARQILRHDDVRGRPLTERQRGLFGLIAGGRKPTRVKR
jgi:hypothetical protein